MRASIKAIQLAQPGTFRVIEIPDPGQPAAGEVRVRVRHVGLCGTDLNAYAGRQPFFTYPRILGHELGVEIEAVGAGVTDLAPGMRGAVEPYLAEAGDRAFARGKTNCARSTLCLGVHLDGGMREVLCLPAQYFHRSELPTRSLALAETLCIGRHGVERARPQGDELAVVVGLGPIGLSVAHFARAAGCALFAVDVSAERLERAQELVPGVRPLRLEMGQTLAAGWDAASAERPELVWDCTGRAASMEASMELVAHGGVAVMVGLLNGRLSFDDPSFHRRELSILASRNATAADFRAVLAAMSGGQVDVGSWITHEAPATELPHVIENWLQPGSGLLKGVIHF